MEEGKERFSVHKKEEVKDGPGKRRRVAEILSRFLRWRPSEKDLQQRNILKNNIDTSKSALGRDNAKKKLTQMYSQYQKTQTGEQQKTYPQIGIEPSKLAEMYPNEPNGIPRVLTICFAYLEKNLQFEGLFRVTGSHIQITNLRMEIENGNFEPVERCLAPQTITGMVSLFFRQLPQPLIPYDMFDSYMKAGALATDDEKIAALKELAEKLPPANYRIMVVFMRLLKKIAQNSAANMMSASNLGLVWGPTLLQAIDPMQSMVGNNLTRSCTLVELMVANYDRIFPSAANTASSPPPQRPAMPTAPSFNNVTNPPPLNTAITNNNSTPQPISPRTVRTIGRTMTGKLVTEPSSLTSSSDSLTPPLSPSASHQLSALGPPPSTPLPPPPIVTPLRPPVAPRNLGSLSKSGGASVASSLTTASSGSPPLQISESNSPTSTPPLSSLSASPPSGISSPARPPRPPRNNTLVNLSLSPKPSSAHPHGEDDESLPGAQVIERYDSNPDLSIYTRANTSESTTNVPEAPPPPPKASAVLYLTRRTIGSKPPGRIPPPPPSVTT